MSWLLTVGQIKPLLFSLMVATAIIASWADRKSKTIWVIIAIISMAGAQYIHTDKRSLTELTNDQQRVVELRKSAYPPITWAPIAYWLEEKPINIAVGRWAESVFENLDPNQYFFANHPRERVGFIEIEKFSYLLLPFGLYGLYRLSQDRSGQITLITSLISLLILGIWGNLGPFGALATWPMWILAIERSIWPKK